MRLEPIRALYPQDKAAAEKLARLDWPSAQNQAFDLGFLAETSEAALLAYRIQREGRPDAWGLVGRTPSTDYGSVLLPHEETLVETVRVRRAYLEKTSVQTGPVLLAGRGADVEEALCLARNAAQASEPLTEIKAGCRTDTLWALDETTVRSVQALLADVDQVLIADGHHRAKATAATCGSILVAVFSEKAFDLGACERLVTGVTDRADLVEKLASHGLSVAPSTGDAPAPRHAKLWDGRAWHDIALGDAQRLTSDSRLLQDKVLAPALSINDPTTEPRLSCLPACEDPRQLEQAATVDDAVALRLSPAKLQLVWDMANQAQLMPPKTTWFTPKPLPGIVATRV